VPFFVIDSRYGVSGATQPKCSCARSRQRAQTRPNGRVLLTDVAPKNSLPSPHLG
jgi:hypothetical protein